MSTKVDDILDLIDGGLQSSDEPGYGTDWAPERCARCLWQEPAEGGDMCLGCRALLLEDSDEDPRRPIYNGAARAEWPAIADGLATLMRHAFGPGQLRGNTYVHRITDDGSAEPSFRAISAELVRRVGEGYEVSYELSPLIRAANSIAAAWRDEMNRLVVSIRDEVIPAFEGLSASLVIVDELPEPRAARERRRHGIAATCPRHGPTRGGTCMKCGRGSSR